MTEEITRRDFLKATGGAAMAAGIASAGPTEQTRAAPRRRRVSPNAKVRMGFIGVAGRGFGGHMRVFGSFPDVEIVAVCDVYEKHLERAVAFTNGKAKGYKDFRRLLEQKNVDAVAIGTPPHWHALMAVYACQAGKDVYCEKPMSRYPAEAQAMAKAAREHGRVTQVGTQIHATPNYHRCVDIVRSGALGRITSVTNFCTMNDDSEGLGRPPDSAPPPGLDWDLWLGPAPKVPFNMGRFRDGMHRYFKDYVNSFLHELGPHIVDLPFWALELGPPKAVAASGGRFATASIADVPDTMQVLWEFPGLTMTWNLMQANAFHFGVGAPGPGRHNGIIFHGKEGTLTLVNYGTPEVLDRSGRPVTGGSYPKSVPDSPGHEREFVDAVKSRRACSCSFEAHLPMHLALNLAHTSLSTGRKLRWDAEKFQVIGDREASALIHPKYRAPWKLPV
jgi:predicted dehydrogenase